MLALIMRNWNSGNWRLARNIILVGFLANFFICLFNYYVLDLEYPNTTFLFRPLDRFQDFFTVLRGTVDLDPYRARIVENVPGHSGIEVSNYFPLTHVVLYPFTLIDPDIALGLFLAVFFAGLGYGVWRVGKSASDESTPGFVFSCFVFIALSYPVLFSADRGNVECWLFLLSALGIYLLASGRFKRGALVIALAAGMKAFPLIFLFPLLRKKQFGALALATVTFILCNLISFAFFEGTIESNIESMRTAFFSFNGFLLLGVNGITHSLSIFSALYTSSILITDHLINEDVLGSYRDYYGIFAVVTFLAALIFMWIKKMPDWMQWALLIALVQVLPFPSYDYKLLYSLIPLAFLVLDTKNPRYRKFVWLIGLAIVPKFYAFFSDVRVGTILNPLLIIAMIVMIAIEPAPVEPESMEKKRKR